MLRDPTQPDLFPEPPKPPFRPLADLTCRQCGGSADPDPEAVRVYICDGPQVTAYCGAVCAEKGRAWPWTLGRARAA